MNNSEDQLYKEAQKRVKLKRNFKEHRNVYLAVMVFLLIINLWTSSEYLWVKWPALGWGFGLVMHWLDVVHKLKGTHNFQSEVEKEMENLKKRAGSENITDKVDGEPFSVNVKNTDENKVKVKR